MLACTCTCSWDVLVVRVSHPDPDSCQTVLALTGRAAFRTALPRVSSWCDAKGRDSLLEFHAHRLRCMHAWGAARARHSRVSLQTSILRTIQDLLRSAQGFEMRVLPPNHSFSKAENRVTSTPANMHPSDRTPKISKQHAPSRHRSPTLSPPGTVRTPFLDAGKSVEPTTHPKSCASVGAIGI